MSETRVAHDEGATAAAVEERFDTLPCGYVAFRDDGIITHVNATLARIIGYPPEELVGRHVESLLAPGGRIFYQTHVFPLLRVTGSADELYLLLRHRDGSDVGTLANARRAQRGDVFESECVVFPVQERRKFEEALLLAKQEAEAARTSLEERNAALDAANHRLEEQATELEQQRAQLEEQAIELEHQQELLQATNTELIDHTELLERERIAAEEANHAKSEFLAVMSHELRTPLNAIGGYVQLMRMGIHGPVTEQQQEALDRIERSQRHLLRLINDVLNLARIEAGRVRYDFVDLPLDEVVASVMPMVEPQLAAKGVECKIDEPRGLVARGDRDKVQQILLNLLTNAVKFTPSGGSVCISTALHAERDDAVLIRVEDTGIGIPSTMLDQIFEAFVQVDATHTRSVEGTGLGLAISRDLARGMGGELTAESEVGQGSVFTLCLPQA